MTVWSRPHLMVSHVVLRVSVLIESLGGREQQHLNKEQLLNERIAEVLFVHILAVQRSKAYQSSLRSRLTTVLPWRRRPTFWYPSPNRVDRKPDTRRANSVQRK